MHIFRKNSFVYTTLKTGRAKTKFLLLAILLVLYMQQGISQQTISSQNRNTKKNVSPISKQSNANSIQPQIKKKQAAESDSLDLLEIRGGFDGSVFLFTGKYTAKLLAENKVIEVQELRVKKSFVFMLKKDVLYTILIEKEGYIPKTISISTKSTDKPINTNPYIFNFETNLISEDLRGHFDDDVLDFPITLIGYNKTCDCFDYNKEYTASIIDEMIKDVLFGR